MLSTMRAAIALPLVLLAWAAAAQPSASLRGSGPLSEVAQNATQQQNGAPPGNATLEPGNATLEAAGWNEGGGKIWGHGAGVEVISPGNVGYYDRGMSKALHHCGGAHCALIVNPPCCRTVNEFHIHFTHYAGYGAGLKQRLERKVCGKGGWHGGGLPCHGKAAFFPGFPGVFSKAMAGGGLHHASVIAWPQSCGGKGTIVEIAYHCSIEHQIRGDFNPRFR